MTKSYDMGSSTFTCLNAGTKFVSANDITEFYVSFWFSYTSH